MAKGKQYRSDYLDVVLMDKGWEDYVWGEVKAVYKFGDYAVIEHFDRMEKEDIIKYHPVYKDMKTGRWEDTNTGWSTIELAVVAAISHRFDGCNTRIPQYFGRMIGMES